MGHFLSRLKATQISCVGNDGRGWWALLEDLSFSSDVLKSYWLDRGASQEFTQANALITVPAGFKTDFMSVPSVLPWAQFLAQSPRAGAVHDYLYTAGPSGIHPVSSRLLADQILREMYVSDITGDGGASTDSDRAALEARADLVFLGVRAGGKPHWD